MKSETQHEGKTAAVSLFGRCWTAGSSSSQVVVIRVSPDREVSTSFLIGVCVCFSS